MKGYKAFGKGLVCKGKQYAENTVFEESEAEICKSGMHFCESPLDVLEYYPLVNENGEFSEFAQVEALDEVYTNDNEKFCTKKLKIGEKLTFDGFINAAVDNLKEKTMPEKISSRDFAQIVSSGNYAKICSSGNDVNICSSGNYAQIGSSGNCAKIGSSGNYAKIGSSGNFVQIGSSGNCVQIGSSGGFAQICSSGNYAQIGSSGNAAKINSNGENSVICCAGHDCKAKAKKGSWITLSEWEYSDKELCIPKCVKTEYVDGGKIKADTWYQLQDGEFVEVKENE